MKPVLEIIIGFAVVILIIIIVAKSDGKDFHYQELLGLEDESARFNSYWNAHSHLGKEQALRRFYRDKDNRERAERLMKEHEIRENRKNDEEDEENSVWHAKPFAVFAHHSFVLR